MLESKELEIVPGVALGSVIAGKYRVDRVLGSGGMGVVVQATHLELKEFVAIKLLVRASESDEFGQRFLREARAAARLKSPHVARSFDVGTLDNGVRYMVMEYLQGADMARLAAERGQMPVSLAIEYLLQACDAIAEAHQHGIIHRDLKPANLFIVSQPDGSAMVKVLDFGISKLAGTPSSQPDLAMTRSRCMMGTPLYASPEQMLSAADVDARADIWSIGVVLYEMLAGQPPFRGGSIPEVIARTVSEDPPPLDRYRSDVPQALEQIVRTCLQKDREARYPSVPDLVAALVNLVDCPLDADSMVVANRIVRRHRVSAPPGERRVDPSPGRGHPIPVAVPTTGNTPLRTGPTPSIPLVVPTPDAPTEATPYAREAPRSIPPVPAIILGSGGLLIVLLGVVLGTWYWERIQRGPAGPTAAQAAPLQDHSPPHPEGSMGPASAPADAPGRANSPVEAPGGLQLRSVASSSPPGSPEFSRPEVAAGPAGASSPPISSPAVQGSSPVQQAPVRVAPRARPVGQLGARSSRGVESPRAAPAGAGLDASSGSDLADFGPRH